MFVLHKSNLQEALTHYPDAQEILNKKAKLLMRKNASLERSRNKPVIVIDNPRAPAETRLLETVMQAVPKNSQANRLLRYGSRGKPGSNFKDLNRVTHNKNSQEEKQPNTVYEKPILLENQEEGEHSFQCDVTVHREMS